MTPGSMTDAELLSSLRDDYRLEELPPYDAPIVLDVGAHVGGFSRYALERWPRAQVYAFEPHPLTFAKLVDQTRGLRIYATRVAVVHPKKSDTVRLYEGVNGSHECSTRDDVRWPHCSQDLTRWHDVPALDASELLPADVLKVDTEGAELAILTGYRHMPGVRALLVEPHAVGGDYRGQELMIRALARAWGLREHGKGIAWRFVRD